MQIFCIIVADRILLSACKQSEINWRAQIVFFSPKVVKFHFLLALYIRGGKIVLWIRFTCRKIVLYGTYAGRAEVAIGFQWTKLEV